MSFDKPTIMAVVTVMVSCAPPDVTKSTELDENDPVDQLDGSPEIVELEDLRKQIDLLIIPAFQSLYFKSAVEVKFSTSKKMITIRKRLKKAKTYLATKKVVLMYLQKYQNHLQDLKKFELKTHINSLDQTLYRRQFIWKNLEDKQNLAVTEILEAIELESKETKYQKFKIRKDRQRPLLRLKGSGDFSGMTQNDIYYLNHLREFLDDSIAQLHQKRYEKKKNRMK